MSKTPVVVDITSSQEEEIILENNTRKRKEPEPPVLHILETSPTVKKLRQTVDSPSSTKMSPNVLRNDLDSLYIRLGKVESIANIAASHSMKEKHVQYVTREELNDLRGRVEKMEERMDKIDQIYEKIKLAFLGANALLNSNSSNANAKSVEGTTAPPVADAVPRRRSAPDAKTQVEPTTVTPDGGHVLQKPRASTNSSNSREKSSANRASTFVTSTPQSGSVHAFNVQDVCLSSTSFAPDLSCQRNGSDGPRSENPYGETPRAPSDPNKTSKTPAVARVGTVPSNNSGQRVNLAIQRNKPGTGQSCNTTSESSFNLSLINQPSTSGGARISSINFPSTSGLVITQVTNGSVADTPHKNIKPRSSLDNQTSTPHQRKLGSLSSGARQVREQQGSNKPVSSAAGLTSNLSQILSEPPPTQNNANVRRGSAVTNCEELPEGMLPNIRIKQEVLDGPNNFDRIDSASFRRDTDNRFLIYIEGGGRKFQNKNQYAAIAGFSLSNTWYRVLPFISDLKPDKIRNQINTTKAQAEIIAAFFALEDLKRNSEEHGALKVTIVSKQEKLINIMADSLRYYSNVRSCDCSHYPCAHHHRWETSDNFAGMFPDDLPRLIVAASSVDVVWRPYLPQEADNLVQEDMKLKFKAEIQKLWLSLARNGPK